MTRPIAPKPLQLSLLASALFMALNPAFAQQDKAADGEKAKELENVVVVGSRSAAKAALDTPAPVGLVSNRDLQNAGPLEVGKLLQTLDPSFNFSTTFISDGTDIIRPATLRSLGPDQLLVLINGKRRHQQALVNVQQTIGRGSAGTDINAIPMSAIDRIEVLRDGAAAQYGSDAISGVINIILKKQTKQTQLSTTMGGTSRGDGDLLSASVNHGFKLSDSGFLNLSLEARDREETNRAGVDSLRVNPPRVTQRIGDSHAKDTYLWWNSELPLGDSGELYAFGGVSRRTGDSAGFYRSKGDGRTVPAIYPNGFLPNIITTVTDQSAAFGYRRELPGGWSLDASVNHGRSQFDFHERNTINVSYWYEPKPGGGIYADSPLSADTGTLKFDQTTFNADLKGTLNFGEKEVSVATGYEYRRDGYGIVAGDPVSYQYGRTNNPNIKIFDQNGGIAAAGTQGFPGYTPSTAVDANRNNIALYLDLEHNVVREWLVTGALRYEKYSDFGATTTGKLATRFDPSKFFGLRGSFSTGFRAPGVQQRFYSQVSTNLNAAGILTETLTAREGSAVTRAFGISPLKQETSRNTNIGLVLRPMKDTSLSVDYYTIDIKDRIVFSSNIDRTLSPAVAAILDPLKVGQAQFFTNAIDTRTRGLDIVAEHKRKFDNGNQLVLSAQMGFNETEVLKRKSQSKVLTGEQLFDSAQVTLVEHGQPRQHHVISADLSAGPWNTVLRANYYGPVKGAGFTADVVTWSGKWVTDWTLRHSFTKQFSVSAGVNNLFDTFPDNKEWKAKGSPFPQLGFTHCWETCPFGINGRSFYARVDYAF